MLKTALLKLLTLKAGAIAVLAVGAGGVAVAASTGVLPNPLSPHSQSTDPAGSNQGNDQTGPLHSNATPSPSLVGLCKAFQAGAGADHGKALDSPAFRALVSAAGGKDQVDAFCQGVLASAPPSHHPTPSGQPGSEATTHPTGHPTPTGHPGP
jgi:hypothetical protein